MTTLSTYSKHARIVVLCEADEAIFSLALQDAFAGIRIIDDNRRSGPTRSSIAVCSNSSVIVEGRLDRASPAKMTSASPPATAFATTYYLSVLRSRWLYGRRYKPNIEWAWDPPTLANGTIDSSYRRDDAEARRFVGKTWRILARVATNKVKKGHPLGNSLMGGDRILMESVKGGMTWCGHQALAWARAGGDRRMLDGTIRPCDDWEIPDNAWYQDLMARAMATDAWHAKTLKDAYP